MSWTFAFLPTRLLREARFLELSPEDGGLLLRLYAACNRYGVGPANEFALRADTGLMLGDRVRPALERLSAAGLLTIYSARSAEWYRLDRYDEDAPADLRRKRGQSEHPLPDGSCGAARAPEDAPRAPEDATRAPDDAPQAPQGRRAADQRRHKGAECRP